MKRFSLKNASVSRHALCLLCISFAVILLELFLITLSLFCLSVYWMLLKHRPMTLRPVKKGEGVQQSLEDTGLFN